MAAYRIRDRDRRTDGALERWRRTLLRGVRTRGMENSPHSGRTDGGLGAHGRRVGRQVGGTGGELPPLHPEHPDCLAQQSGPLLKALGGGRDLFDRRRRRVLVEYHVLENLLNSAQADRARHSLGHPMGCHRPETAVETDRHLQVREFQYFEPWQAAIVPKGFTSR